MHSVPQELKNQVANGVPESILIASRCVDARLCKPTGHELYKHVFDQVITIFGNTILETNYTNQTRQVLSIVNL